MNDEKIWLETEDGQKLFIIKSEKIDMQEELNKTIETLKQELQRKDNEINDLKSSIADYQEVVGDYHEELKRKDNNWNELKEFIQNELNRNVDKEKSFGGYQCKIILDKIKELENENI